jgi:hypothetical protein
MRIAFWCLALLGCLSAGAQVRYDHELELTETRFALESQIHGLKWGFLHNMDTGALGIGNNGFVNLHTVWKERPDESSFLLQWKPTQLWWSDDGLFGLTTGPFFTQAAKDSAVKATGFFFTIWKRDKVEAPFTFVVDAGLPMSNPKPVSSYVGVPVVKDVIKAKGIIQNKTSPAGKAVSDRSLDFKTQSGVGSLMKALDKYAAERSILIFSNHGKVDKRDLGKVAVLNMQYHFQSVDTKELSGGCYYEWGRLREAHYSKMDPVTGYYVHVWQVVKGTPRLLAAVHRFDQGQTLQ